MARATIKKTVPADVAPSEPVLKSAPKKSPVPRSAKPAVVSPAKSAPTFEQIAQRAYELWQAGAAGGQDDHWFAAERELR